jgi:membrane-bound lytic murein transglycosylase A
MTVEKIPFSQLSGWADDDHATALSVFLMSCDKIQDNNLAKADDWNKICAFAKTTSDARAFFEEFFQPVLIHDGQRSLFTGYYEPEIPGSRQRSGPFQYPLYKRPPELVVGEPWKTRAEIDGGALSGRGLELAYLADPVESFFLHVQGSGRIKLIEGGFMRVGFAAKNGHPYRSIGKELIQLGLIDKNDASAQRIKDWIRENPKHEKRILHHNLSYVFFRELIGLDPSAGPLGAMQVSVTTDRTLAVDPDFTPLGAPVWIAKTGHDPINRLMIAQDVGSAIKGAQRGDIYFGAGDEVGRIAGRLRDRGRMYTLLPIAAVRRLLPEG